MIVYQCAADGNHNKASLIAGITPAPGSSTSSLMSLRPSHAYGVTSKKGETWGVWGLWQMQSALEGLGRREGLYAHCSDHAWLTTVLH